MLLTINNAISYQKYNSIENAICYQKKNYVLKCYNNQRSSMVLLIKKEYKRITKKLNERSRLLVKTLT